MRVMLIGSLSARGGTEKHIVDLLKHVGCSGLSYHLVLLNRPNNVLVKEVRCLAESVRVINAPKITRVSPADFVRTAELIHERKVDLVHSLLLGPNVIATLLGITTGRPSIVSWRNDDSDSPLRRKIVRIAVNQLASTIVFNSRIVAQKAVEKEFAPCSKIRVIPNGIALSGRVQPSEVAKNNNKIKVSVVASLTEKKGHLYLLQALSQLSDRARRSLHVAIIGKGPLEQEIQKRIVEYELQELVSLEGETSDVSEWLRRSDLFVLPSTKEGVSNAAIEAMNHGLPVVATDVGGMSELVEHEVTGLIVPPQDPSAIRVAIEYLVENPAVRVRFGTEGLKRISESFSMSQMTQSYRRLYTEVTALNQRSPPRLLAKHRPRNKSGN